LERRVRLITIGVALGLLAAGLAMHGSGSTGSGTFRDAAYGVSYKHHVKLTGEVAGFNRCQKKGCAHGTEISIHKSKTKVGAWTGMGNCAGFGKGAQCNWAGTGTMKIGSLKGKVRITIACQHVARPPGTGSVLPYKIGVVGKSEGIRMNKPICPPGKKGAKFGFTLSY
jgi:hypothetical protein